jgi:peroxiredoxin
MDSGSGAVQKVKGFAEKNNLTYPMLMDDGKTSKSYAVYNIPATYILDRNHVIIKIYKGYMPGLGDRMAEQIEQLLRASGHDKEN